MISISLLSSCILLFDASPVHAQVNKTSTQEGSRIVPTFTQLAYFVGAMVVSLIAVLIIVYIGGRALRKSIIGTISTVDSHWKTEGRKSLLKVSGDCQ